MCRGHDPLFSGHPALLSLPIYHHCAALMPPFSNFRKIFHFQPCFGQNFSSQDANFPNFRSLDPSFFKENPLPRPYFWKPVWHTPTKKKVECPPRHVTMPPSAKSLSTDSIQYSEILAMAQICTYKQNKLISKITVDYNFVSARLCMILLHRRLLCCIRLLDTII